MITLEEIYNRYNKQLEGTFSKKKRKTIEEKIEETYVEKEEESWKPHIIKDYNVPDFNIYESTAKGSESKRRNKLSKVLAFVYHIQHKRSNDYCTIMPISITSKYNLQIWDSEKNVSRAIDYMKEIGLIEVEDNSYQFGAYYECDNRSKVYRYYVENEKKLIEYCEKWKINKYIINNYKEYSNKDTIADSCKTNQKSQNLYSFSPDEVLFSSHLNLKKPENISKGTFKKYLIQCLYNNYYELAAYQKTIDRINNTYYKDYPELQIRFEPSFNFNSKKAVKSIGIRATNKLCNIKKSERQKKLDKYGLTLQKDVKSSVPRLNLSLNTGKWIDENIDMYELIFNELEPGKQFTNEKREAIKHYFLRAYFDKTDETFCRNNWNCIDQEDINKADVYKTLKDFREALIKVEGNKLYGSEIFYVESCAYINTLEELLMRGRLVWLLYDCFYSTGNETQEEFEEYISKNVKESFELFYFSFKFRKGYQKKLI